MATRLYLRDYTYKQKIEIGKLLIEMHTLQEHFKGMVSQHLISFTDPK
jgi:hypothetical protein